MYITLSSFNSSYLTSANLVYLWTYFENHVNLQRGWENLVKSQHRFPNLFKFLTRLYFSLSFGYHFSPNICFFWLSTLDVNQANFGNLIIGEHHQLTSQSQQLGRETNKVSKPFLTSNIHQVTSLLFNFKGDGKNILSSNMFWDPCQELTRFQKVC